MSDPDRACDCEDTYVTNHCDPDGVGERICKDCGEIVELVQVKPPTDQWDL